LRIAVVVGGAACMAPGCNDDVLSDPTFRMWDGDKLISWRIDSGNVRRAPTWHEDDPGVELLDTPTQIAQASSRATDCMEFSAIADVDASAKVTLEVDLDFDGKSDLVWPIAETRWRSTKTIIHLPRHTSGFMVPKPLRFVVHKAGAGRAVLAQIRIVKSDECRGTPEALRERPIGGTCVTDADCTSGVCGELAVRNDGVDVVIPGVCQECDEQHACAGGAACKQREVLVEAAKPAMVPKQCAPGEGKAQAGALCLDASDCASGSCENAGFNRDPMCLDSGSTTCPPITVRAGRCR
jgi:hypothetical protein